MTLMLVYYRCFTCRYFVLFLLVADTVGGSSLNGGPSSLVMAPVSQPIVTPRRSNTSVTIINHNNNNAAIVAASQVTP